MNKRELSDDVMEALDSTPGEAVELLERFEVNDYWEIPFNLPNDPRDTTKMMTYVQRLKQAGLDIGKGDSQFGYKMPLPEKDKSTRYLQIFRRKE